ncbi:KilA-N domain-containing protein [Myxosarcina sp. GI1(2024)]
MDFNKLVKSNTRDDEYVNATKLCKAFGKEWRDFKKLNQTKNFLKALQGKLSSLNCTSKSQFTKNKLIQSRGRAGTYVHPLIAIKLAEWLSPEFEVFVKETFKGFLEADPELTKNLISRTESLEDLDAIAEKTEIQRQYLRSEFTLNYEGGKIESEHSAHWFTSVVKRYNNDCAGVKDGERPSMPDNDKATLLFTQLAQAKQLERNRKSDNPYLSAGEAKDDCYSIAKQAAELMSGRPAPKPRDWDRMKQASRNRLFPAS